MLTRSVGGEGAGGGGLQGGGAGGCKEGVQGEYICNPLIFIDNSEAHSLLLIHLLKKIQVYYEAKLAYLQVIFMQIDKANLMFD